MSEQKINLEEILDKHSQIVSDGLIIEYSGVYDAMKEAIRIALKLAAERAEIESNPSNFNEDGMIYRSDIFINKSSILSVIDQVK